MVINMENRQLRYKGYKGSVEFNAEDNLWQGEIQDLKNHNASYESETKEELESAFRNAVHDFDQSVRWYYCMYGGEFANEVELALEQAHEFNDQKIIDALTPILPKVKK